LSTATPGATEAPYDGRTLVVDTSAWSILRRAANEAPTHHLIAEFQAALLNGQLRGCDAVKLEMLHNARSPTEFIALEANLDRVSTLPITATDSRAAVGALRDLSAHATRSDPMLHRVGHGDTLVAAVAAERGFDVLHYDHLFDTLATVLRFDSVWIATPGEF
jgi:predicted nucleic acid-binding protein